MTSLDGRARVAATVACLSLLASGCGGGDDNPLPSATPASSPTAQATVDASTAPSPSATAAAIDPASLTAFTAQKVDWTTCGGGFQCAKVKVPVDYAKPG